MIRIRPLSTAALAAALLLSIAHARGRHHRRYEPPRTEPAALTPWSSPEACSAALERHEHQRRPPGTARIATWNVRWFPDGVPGNPGEGGPKATDVDWLACTIAWLDVDVLALQEIKSTPAATNALMKLIASLDRLTGGRHRVELDHCPGAGRQSVAFLYDERRVRGSGFHDEAALNPTGHACDGLLRPGFAGYFRWSSGMDAHLVAVHLKSGTSDRDLALRRKSIAGLPEVYAALQKKEADTDVVLLGDYNTMGCSDCSPPFDGAGENAVTRRTLLEQEPSFRKIDAAPACSEYSGGESSLLDHFTVTASMREVEPSARAHVEGYCAERACARIPRREKVRAREELSDHCPVVLDFGDRDVD